jgi:MFS family permease
MNKFLKLSWPHAVAILSLVILSSIYFSPLWQGYDLDQHDIVQWRGMSQELSNYRELHNEEALWSNSMFGGMPAYQVSTEHNANLLRPILLTLRLGLPGAIGTLFLCFLGYYILGLCLRLGPWYSLVGAVAFGFATINILYLGAGHTGKVTSIAFLAPALGGFILAFRGRAYLGGAIFMLFLGLNIAANHLQMTYYLAFLLIAVAIGESVRLAVGKQLKALLMSLAVLAVATVVAILPSASNLMTTYEYSKYTTRGSSDLTLKPKESSNIEQEGLSGSYILDYNFASGEQWSLLIPNAKGGASEAIGDNNKDAITKAAKENRNVNKFKDDLKGTNSYWGGQRFTGGAFYFGAAIMTLFILSFFGLKDGIKWPFLFITLLALALCLKEMTGLNSMFIENIPMYNKFRDSKMILVLIQVIAPLMGIMFLKQLKEGEVFFDRKVIPAASVISTGGLILIFRRNFWNKTYFWSNKNDKTLITSTIALFVLVVMFLYVNPNFTGSMITPQEQEQFDQMAKSAPKEQVAMIDDYSSALQDVRAEIFKADAKRSLFLVILISGAVLALVYVKNSTLKMAILPIIGVIALLDGFSVSRRYLNLDKEKGAYKKFVAIENKEIPVKAKAADFSILDLEKPNVADFDNKSNELEQALKNSGIYDHVKSKDAMKEVANFGALQLNSDFRVARLGNPFNDAETSFFHKSIGGYHGAKLKRMQEVIDFHLSEELDSAIAYLQAGTFDSLGGSLTVLNMLNTKYYIGNPEQPAFPNKFAMGNAWFVSQVKTTNNSDEEIVALGEIDPKVEATTQAAFGTQFHAPQNAVDSTASVRMLAYETKVLRYEVNNTSAEAQPVVFSEIYYPQGWICRIDGNEVEAARVNYVLRGAMIPAGTHTVEWSFEPKVWEKGTTISYAGSALLFALLAFAGFMVYKEEKKA